MTFPIITLVFVLLLVGSVVYYTLGYGIGPTPTASMVRVRLLQTLPNTLPGPVIYELGAGWGTLLFPLARRYPKYAVKGIEVSPVPWLWLKLRLLMRPLSNVCVSRRDFFQVDLSDAGLVVCYLYPGAMQRLSDKLKTELKPGTYIITHTFRLPQWTPMAVVEVEDLYLYRR